MKDKLKELELEYQRKKKQIQLEQFQCNHCWDSPEYDPETKKEPCGYRVIGQGSDVWVEAVGYSSVNIPRWSRICKKCGKVEYTYRCEPIIANYEPKF